MFQTEGGNFPQDLEYSKMLAERNYKIQINDKLDIRVYTNEGERIIDPDYVLQEEIRNSNVEREKVQYYVEKDGMVKIPMIGPVRLVDLTIREAESLLEEKFSGFYKEPYVVVKFTNKRVIVLGKLGGQVIPLENEDMSLIEVLALAGGLEEDSKAQNIRLIRGDLKNPEVQIIDLSTIEGMMKADLKIYSGDIIYVEPVVRGFAQGTREFLPIVSVLASLVAIIVAIQALSTN
jgi:polysaccharide export outer membrane protein